MTAFNDDDCCCCCYEDCCDSRIECCDDPACVVEVAPKKIRKQSRRTSSAVLGSSGALQSLLFLGFAVASASAQAIEEAESAGNSTLLGAESMVDADACAASEMGEYNVGFHIGGIFIVLLISGFGIFMTLALGAHAKAPIFARVLQIFKMFGIGVIAGTAWIHLLPDAFEAFGSPCLPSAWAEYGGAYVGVFGLTAAFLVQFIELTAVDFKNRRAASLKKDSDSVTINEGPACTDLDHVAVSGNSAAFLEAGNGPRVHSAAKVNAESQFSVNDAVPSAHSGKDTHSQHSHSHGSSERNSELGTILLESGIIFHSLIIGITLGVTPDEAFTTLLIAVSFHQLFEGMALGVLISRLNLSLLFKGLMSCAYPLTTPIGIAIGMAIRHYYNENDGGLILTQGIFDSLSAGILFYNTYTELMSGEVSHNGHFHGFTRGFKAACFFAMYAGAACMAVLAVWA